MSKDELLKTEFNSAHDAMYALALFLQEVYDSNEDANSSEYQHLRGIGNRIFD